MSFDEATDITPERFDAALELYERAAFKKWLAETWSGYVTVGERERELIWRGWWARARQRRES